MFVSRITNVWSLVVAALAFFRLFAGTLAGAGITGIVLASLIIYA
jgi:hypothetical protein